MEKPYQYDELFNVWIKKDYKSSILYSDGDETEQRIFRLVQQSSDVSCMSEELEAAIADWTSLCFFSRKRANLLRPFQSLFDGKRILEVGCGAGPICRFLGESGATVYGLEPSIQRARIAAERCRDLPNVSIFCDDIAHFNITETFDGIVMVGVLEYATKYSGEKNAALDFLTRLKKFIRTDTGFMITAIENQLGLKYFSGFAEDHAGAFMHGINNNYQPGEATTYGRKCLQDIFQQAGFPLNEFYLPFPDYKMPSLIFYPGFNEKIKDTDFTLDSILSNISYTDPQYKAGIFSLDKALPLVAKNDLLTELSNSFCILSRFNADEKVAGSVIFTLYNTARKKEYCKEISFHKDGQAVKIIRKYLDKSPAKDAAGDIISFPAEEPALPGTIFYYELVKIMNQPGWHADQVGDWLAKWFQFVMDELIINEAYRKEDFQSPHLQINPKYIDAVPINVIVHEGRHAFIDLEVNLHESIETGYLIFRAVYSSVSRLSSLAMPGDAQYIDIDTLLVYLFNRLGYPLDEKKLDEYYEKEARLVAAVASSKFSSMRGSITRLGIRTPLQNLLLNPPEVSQLEKQNEVLKKSLRLQEEKAALLKLKLLEQASLIEKLATELTGESQP